jgi:hypothetical protein
VLQPRERLLNIFIEDIMKSIFTRLRAKFDRFLHQRYLEKMGLTEEAYQRKTDSLVNYRALTVSSFYHGYKAVHTFQDAGTAPWSMFDDWLSGLHSIREWCEENCSGKWRDDIHRVIKQTSIGVNGETEEHLFMNEIGGRDVVCFAFENDADYLLFLLRWA